MEAPGWREHGSTVLYCTLGIWNCGCYLALCSALKVEFFAAPVKAWVKMPALLGRN